MVALKITLIECRRNLKVDIGYEGGCFGEGKKIK